MRQPNGQNFLIDANIANKIVKSASISKSDFVIEIGPGKGVLTDILKNLTDNLIIVDIDRQLADNLVLKYRNDRNVTVINKDFLKFDLPQAPFKVVANLPYNVGTAIVQKLLPSTHFISAVFMLQKDVITRLVSGPGQRITDIFQYSENITPTRVSYLTCRRAVLILNRKLCPPWQVL